VSVIDELLATPRATRRLHRAALPGRSRPSASRLGLHGRSGSTRTACWPVREGDAHVIRNAGGGRDRDELRSLAISQRLLGTTEIMLIHHTGCGC
jgi:hypothetical protein